MIKTESRNLRRQKRHLRVRSKVHGTGERPRLVVFRSNGHIYAQVVDDTEHRTLLTVSSLDKSMTGSSGGNIEGAKKVGSLLADRAKEKGISQVVFDRGGYLYHGRVAALAEAARSGGLQF